MSEYAFPTALHSEPFPGETCFVEAYNVLTDQDKRRRYDTTGRTDRSHELRMSCERSGVPLPMKISPKTVNPPQCSPLSHD